MTSEAQGFPESSAQRHREIGAEIQRMAFTDQDVRKKNFADGEEWMKRAKKVDEENTARMKKIISEIGWPTIAKVGAEASKSAWLLVQHADLDPEFQEACLVLMKQSPSGEVRLHDVAYLEDRVRVNTGQAQVYGTQFDVVKDAAGAVIGFEPHAIEEQDSLDERRAEMGLEPFENYKQAITKLHYPEFLKEN